MAVPVTVFFAVYNEQSVSLLLMPVPPQRQNNRRRVSTILDHIRRVVSSRSVVLHYEGSIRELDVWYW